MMPLKIIISWFMMFFAMHLAVRGILVRELLESVTFAHATSWLRGIVSDALMALVLALLAIGLRRLRRWLPWVFFVLWALILSGNREYINEWASNLSVFDIAGMMAPEFIKGSVLTPRLLITAGTLGLVGFMAYMLTQRLPIMHTLSRRYICALAVLPFLVAALPAAPPQLWIQENLIEENVRQLVSAAIPNESDLPPTAVAAAQRFMVASRRVDLRGKRIVTPYADANIIIINIESLSDNILQNGWMPHLQALAENNLHYTQFILPNLTTIRGLYAQFCGEATFLGRFGRDSMHRHIRQERVECLPDILNNQGYRTVYMQGANLGFQNKDEIIPATGFLEVLGNKEIPEGERFSEWGLDDVSLFDNAARKIESIERDFPDAPWMLALMTVGTHHPYNVNPSFEPKIPLRERAFRYADQAIWRLVEWLKTTHRLEKTLLIITGDESREKRRSQTGLGATIVRNQGILVVIAPFNEKKKVAEPFMQTDLLLSVLDFADLEIPNRVGGRSIFREYTDFRPLAFSNYSQQSIFAFWKAGELTQCRTDSWECRLFPIGNASLFDPNIKFAGELTASDLTQALYEENRKYWAVK